jgi:uncharacterized protein
VLGTLPGVIGVAFLRVFVVPGQQVFKLIVAAVLLPLGLWLIRRTGGAARQLSAVGLSERSTVGLASLVGVIGGSMGSVEARFSDRFSPARGSR